MADDTRVPVLAAGQVHHDRVEQMFVERPHGVANRAHRVVSHFSMLSVRGLIRQGQLDHAARDQSHKPFEWRLNVQYLRKPLVPPSAARCVASKTRPLA
jgi:hypothetical protein